MAANKIEIRIVAGGSRGGSGGGVRGGGTGPTGAPIGALVPSVTGLTDAEARTIAIAEERGLKKASRELLKNSATAHRAALNAPIPLGLSGAATAQVKAFEARFGIFDKVESTSSIVHSSLPGVTANPREFAFSSEARKGAYRQGVPTTMGQDVLGLRNISKNLKEFGGSHPYARLAARVRTKIQLFGFDNPARALNEATRLGVDADSAFAPGRFQKFEEVEAKRIAKASRARVAKNITATAPATIAKTRFSSIGRLTKNVGRASGQYAKSALSKIAEVAGTLGGFAGATRFATLTGGPIVVGSVMLAEGIIRNKISKDRAEVARELPKSLEFFQTASNAQVVKRLSEIQAGIAQRGFFEDVATGAVAGATTGLLIGAGIGSPLGPAGAFIGGLLGATVGTVTGAAIGGFVNAAGGFSDEERNAAILKRVTHKRIVDRLYPSIEVNQDDLEYIQGVTKLVSQGNIRETVSPPASEGLGSGAILESFRNKVREASEAAQIFARLQVDTQLLPMLGKIRRVG